MYVAHYSVFCVRTTVILIGSATFGIISQGTPQVYSSSCSEESHLYVMLFNCILTYSNRKFKFLKCNSKAKRMAPAY